MITVIQRVSSASVTVDRHLIGQIDQGIVALIAVEKNDNAQTANRLLQRILTYRIFADDSDRMNLSLQDINGGLLLIPQFTLAADTDKGNRPSFSYAAAPELGRQLFDFLREQALTTYSKVQFGRFGADMKIALVNDGPVTFMLRTH